MDSPPPLAPWHQRLGGRLLRADPRIVLPCVLAVHLGLTLFTHAVTLRRFPNSGDEYAYLLSARIFAEARLSVPSPEPREFFDVVHVLNDGKFYGKYPPGWPLLLSIGVLLRAPFLVNALLGALTLGVMYATARKNFSLEVANLSLYLTLGNPYLIFTSASYFSHPACLLFISLFLYFYLDALDDPGRRKTFVLLGLAAGAAFVTRPYTAVVVLVPLLAYRSWRAARGGTLRPLVPGLALAALPFAVMAGLFLLYNFRQTGSALVQPFNRYDPNDHLGTSPTSQTWAWGFRTNVVERLLRLGAWLPFSVLFLIPYLFQPANRRNPRSGVMVAVFLSLLAGYSVYLFDAKNEYGPRYMYESTVALLIVAACVLREFGKGGALVVAAILAVNGWMFQEVSRVHAEQVRDRMRVYDLVRERGVDQAVVFMTTGSGSMPSYDLTRNGIHFDGGVLYVKDLGRKNLELLSLYPERKAYCYIDRDRGAPAELVPVPRGPR